MNKKVAGLFGIFLLVLAFVCESQTQNATAQDELQEAQLETQKDAGMQNVAQQNQDDFSYLFSTTQDDDTKQTKEPNTFFAFLKMILVLSIVLFCIYAVFFFVKKNTPTLSNDDLFLRRVASISVGTGKSVQVVTLLDNAYLIGVAEQNINLLGKIEDKELVESMNLNFDRTTATTKPKTFADVLNIFLKKPNQANLFQEAETSAANILQKRRSQSQGMTTLKTQKEDATEEQNETDETK